MFVTFVALAALAVLAAWTLVLWKMLTKRGNWWLVAASAITAVVIGITPLSYQTYTNNREDNERQAAITSFAERYTALDIPAILRDVSPAKNAWIFLFEREGQQHIAIQLPQIIGTSDGARQDLWAELTVIPGGESATDPLP